MRIIWKKEMEAYYGTPFGYVFTGIFLMLSGIMFTVYNLLGGNSSLAGMFGLLKNFTFLIFPILTMRMFAEERRTGTESYLLTSKLTEADVVIGKYLAACTMFMISLAITLVYVVIINAYGYMDVPAIAVSYLGFFLLGTSMIAVCTFASSFAENQITAAITSFGALFLMSMLLSLAKMVSVPVLTQLLNALAITRYYDGFTLGVLSLGPVMYYLGVSAVSIALSVIYMGYRRYR